MLPYQRVFESFNSDKIVFKQDNPDKQKFHDMLKEKGIQFATTEKDDLCEYVFDLRDWPRVQELVKASGIQPDGTKLVLLGGKDADKESYTESALKPYRRLFESTSKKEYYAVDLEDELTGKHALLPAPTRERAEEFATMLYNNEKSAKYSKTLLKDLVEEADSISQHEFTHTRSSFQELPISYRYSGPKEGHQTTEGVLNDAYKVSLDDYTFIVVGEVRNVHLSDFPKEVF
jgi:hypothetical protein